MASKKPARKVAGTNAKAVQASVETKSEPVVVASTSVRSTPTPKTERVAPVVTHEMIARRAWEISQSESCGGELDNWLRAERELRGL